MLELDRKNICIIKSEEYDNIILSLSLCQIYNQFDNNIPKLTITAILYKQTDGLNLIIEKLIKLYDL